MRSIAPGFQTAMQHIETCTVRAAVLRVIALHSLPSSRPHPKHEHTACMLVITQYGFNLAQ
eukprot:708762-Amphidinium_carterae.1